jgi:glycerol kinase
MITAILAIDQGTTNSKAVLVSTEGEIVARGTSPVGISHPQPGWVEQSPERVWGSVLEAIAACLAAAPAATIAGIAISNQRESVTIWDGETGEPLGPVISWQCRRSAPVCAELNAAGHSARVEALTGCRSIRCSRTEDEMAVSTVPLAVGRCVSVRSIPG